MNAIQHQFTREMNRLDGRREPTLRLPTRRFLRGRGATIATPLIAFGICLTSVARLSAQNGDPARSLDAVAPLLDAQTFGVVRIDTTRLNLDAIAAQMALFPMLSEHDRSGLAAGKKKISDWFDRFHRAGGRELFLVFRFADDWLRTPFVVVPLRKQSDALAIAGQFVRDKLTGPAGADYPMIVDGSIERNGVLILGSNAQLSRLQNLPGPERTIPSEAFQAVADGEIQAFLLLDDDKRRVLAEFLRDPQAEQRIFTHMPPRAVPSEFLRDPREIARLALTDGLQWVAVGLNTRGTLALKLVVGSKDAASVQALKLWIAGMFEFVKQTLPTSQAPAREREMLITLVDQLSRLLAPKVVGNRVILRVTANDLVTSVAGAFLRQATVGAMRSSESQIVKNHLKQLTLAMHNYVGANGRFPPAAFRDRRGKPLLSWRVGLLPFLDQNELYRQFHLDEPWDGPHNKALIEKMPSVFAARSAGLARMGKTTFLVPVGRQTIFGPKEGVTIQDIKDGTVNTILIVDSDEQQAVPWTKPEDLPLDGADVSKGLYGSRQVPIYCAFADGSVRLLRPQLDASILRAMLTRDGGEIVPLPSELSP